MFSKDDAIEARWQSGAQWYPGRVIRSKLNELNEVFYDIMYDDGGIEYDVPFPLIRLFSKEGRRRKNGQENIVLVSNQSYSERLNMNSGEMKMEEEISSSFDPDSVSSTTTPIEKKFLTFKRIHSATSTSYASEG